jgi:type IV pilus biogenesis protein CpaD/CtpE
MTIMHRKPLISKVTLALLAFLTLEGCQVPDQQEIPMPDKPYELQHDMRHYSVEFHHKSSQLSFHERARLVAALKPSGPGKVSIHLTIPNNGSGLGKQRLKQIIRTALEAGLKAKQIHRSNDLPPAHGSCIQVQLDTYRAIAPLCPNWSTVYGSSYNRGNTSNFGCATAINFLMMIDDPIILFKGEHALSHDAARDSLAIADHRAGKDKGKWLKVETAGSGSTSSSSLGGTQ